jgi:hypothetical protein
LQTWQKEFFEKTNLPYNEVGIFCANQVGKTRSVSVFVAINAVGDYDLFPDYNGRKWDHPLTIVIASHTAEHLRNVFQNYIAGPFEPMTSNRTTLMGTGDIPGQYIYRCLRKHAPLDAIDTLYVRHKSGKRTNTTNGLIIMPMTPTEGFTPAVSYFYPRPTMPNRVLIKKGIFDTDDWFYSKERKRQIWNETREEERACRCNGEPYQGSGKIFDIPKINYIISRHDFDHLSKENWLYGEGIDFGAGTTACVWGAKDTRTDIIYIFAEYQQQKQPIYANVVAIKNRRRNLFGFIPNLPVFWPNDGVQTQDDDCSTLADQWRRQDMNLVAEQCHLLVEKSDPKGRIQFVRSFKRDPMLEIMYQKMNEGTVLIVSDCYQLLDQIDVYHKKDGKIVKERDHLVDAARHLIIDEKKMEPLDKYRLKKTKMEFVEHEFDVLAV